MFSCDSAETITLERTMILIVSYPVLRNEIIVLKRFQNLMLLKWERHWNDHLLPCIYFLYPVNIIEAHSQVQICWNNAFCHVVLGLNASIGDENQTNLEDIGFL